MLNSDHYMILQEITRDYERLRKPRRVHEILRETIKDYQRLIERVYV